MNYRSSSRQRGIQYAIPITGIWFLENRVHRCDRENSVVDKLLVGERVIQ
jgi:hypothetical protein